MDADEETELVMQPADTSRAEAASGSGLVGQPLRLPDPLSAKEVAEDLPPEVPPPLPVTMGDSEIGGSLPESALSRPATAASSSDAILPRSTTPTPVTPDPLEDVADVIWYVLPPSGGQYGPANRDVMRTWLAEGRITPDSQVWREGWRDWKDAVAVFPEAAFPQFRIAEEMPGLDNVLGPSTAAFSMPGSSGHSAVGPRTLLSHTFLLIIVAALGAAVLAAVYFWARFF